MPELTISNFKFGLDTRRSELTSQPGSLVTCQNGHINQGAQFEKRFAFVKIGNLPRNQTLSNGDTLNAYGLLDTPTGVMCFGSSDSTVNVIPQGTPFVFPPGVVYQRLQHPLKTLAGFSNNISFGNTGPNLTSVVASACFNGSALVSASFAAGAIQNTNPVTPIPARSFYYFNGPPIPDQFVGYVLLTDVTGPPFLSINSLSIQLSDYFDTYFPSGLFTSSLENTYPNANAVDITGPIGIPFATTITDVGGTLTDTNLLQSNGEITGAAATATIFVVSGASGSINTIKTNNAGTGTVDLLQGTPVNYSTSKLVTAQLVAAAINSNTAITGYTASASIVTGTTVAQITVTGPIGTIDVNGVVINTSTLQYNSTTLKLSIAPNAGGATGNVVSNAFAGGVNPSSGAPQVDKLSFSTASWVYNSNYVLTITANDIEYTIGNGNIGGIVPTFIFPFGSKAYFVTNQNNNLYFSSINNATLYENQDTGAGNFPIVDLTNSPSGPVALASFQGKLAVFGRRNIQLWNTNADPAQYSLFQSLDNMGTISSKTVKGLGDLDVLFLSDTGVRSLRVRDSSLAGYIVDLGSAIDSLIVDSIQMGGDSTTWCSVVDPQSNRYWLSINGTIYVLSYYPTLKIIAWSTYLPTYDPGTGIQTVFNPVDMVTHNGLVYLLDDQGGVYIYGGTNGVTYDGIVATVELPWLDHKRPFEMKSSERVNIAMTGQWQIKLGMDPKATIPLNIVVPFPNPTNPATPNEAQDSTFDGGTYAVSQLGTHFKFHAETSPTYKGAATLSELILQYNLLEQV